MSNQPSCLFALVDDARAVGDEAIDERDVCAVGDALHVVGDGDVARHEDVGFDAGGSGVGGERACGVAGGRDGELLQSVMAGHGDGQREAARLEGAGGVGAFFFEIHVAVAAAVEHGRPALAEGDGLDVGQHGAIAPHAGGGRGACFGRRSGRVLRCPLPRRDRSGRRERRRSAGRESAVFRRRRAMAAGAFEMGDVGHGLKVARADRHERRRQPADAWLFVTFAFCGRQ